MSWVDILLALCIIVGFFHGYKAGFLLELFSLVAVILGVIGGFKLMGWSMVLLADKFNVDKKILPYIAFAVVFIVIVIIVNLLGKLIKTSVDKSVLGGLDQISGGLLGAVRTTFMLSITLWILDSLGPKLLSKWADDSWLHHAIAGFAPKLTSWLGDLFPVFEDVF